LRLTDHPLSGVGSSSQKAPSTRRCIETRPHRCHQSAPPVRKHPAPEGALRQPDSDAGRHCVAEVRKHLAPEGALRRQCCCCGFASV